MVYQNTVEALVSYAFSSPLTDFNVLKEIRVLLMLREKFHYPSGFKETFC